MNISVTIPQVFYDLIARVIPGFVFLLALDLELSGTGLHLIQWPTSSNTSMAVLFNALGYCVVLYVIGWILLAFTFLSLREKVKAKYEDKPIAKPNSISFSEMYQRIRLKNEAAGFRIAKLRAEARMLETSRTAMVYILVISLGLLILSRSGVIPSFRPSPLEWALRLTIPAILATAFRMCEKRAWGNYYGNIDNIYKILSEAASKNGKNQEQPPTAEK